MSVAILLFDICCEDDKEEFERTKNAKNYYDALWDVDMRLRDTEKYDKPAMTREEFHKILNSFNVILD